MDSNDISDEYRKVMVEGLEKIADSLQLTNPALRKVLREASKEIRLLDKQLKELKEQITNHFLSEVATGRENSILKIFKRQPEC